MFINANKMRKPLATALMWLMLCVVLFSQYLGYAHRMAHINSYAGAVLTIAFDEQGQFELRKLSDSEAQLHSCLLLDASTIVDALQHTITWDFAQVLMPREVEATVLHSWMSRIQLVFRSRAPPL